MGSFGLVVLLFSSHTRYHCMSKKPSPTTQPNPSPTTTGTSLLSECRSSMIHSQSLIVGYFPLVSDASSFSPN